MATQLQVPSYPNELRVHIRKAGYSFREVSQETGVPESTLYDWAAGNRPIPHTERKIFAHLLGCPIEVLAPEPSLAVATSVPVNHLLQYKQEHLLLSEQQGYDMDKKRRLILRAIGIVGTAFVASFEQLLEVEPWRGIAQAATKPSSITMDTLVPFQKLTEACWHMSNGSELDTVEQLLPTYLPQLAILAQQTSIYQSIAAGIAAQGYLLSYVIASNREEFKLAFSHCQKARTYAQIAHDANLEAVALIRQGVVGLHRKRPYQTLESYKEALQFVDDVSPLIRTRLYASLCEVQGKLGMEQEARRNIGLAQESFPDDTTLDPASLYIHFSKSGLYLHEGLALLDLHKPGEALDTLLNIDGLHPKLAISERSRIDVLNQQALAAGGKGDLEQFHLYLEGAVTSAHKLGSDLRYSEAWDVYTRVQAIYPREPQVGSLNTLFASR
jgi:tetratricopeptide (TPR) repeat protein/lambda repressor-like predicted transcriptional regulator